MDKLLMGKPDQKDDRPANEQLADLQGLIEDIQGRIEGVLVDQMPFILEECGKLSQAVKEKDAEIRGLRATIGRYESYVLESMTNTEKEIPEKMQATSTISLKTRKNMAISDLEKTLDVLKDVVKEGVTKIERSETEEEFQLNRREARDNVLRYSGVLK